MNIHADKRENQRVSENLTLHPPLNAHAFPLQDNRPQSAIQKKQVDALANRQIIETPIRKGANRTGLPDQLKTGIENLSGHSMDNVKVHYNSDKPAQLNAHAYAQGTAIHIAPGQEKHLPHEAWHVVQQKQGRVKPTIQMKGGVPVNNDRALEMEADVMGKNAALINAGSTQPALIHKGPPSQNNTTIQRLGPAVAASNAVLVAEYNNMLNAPDFAALNTKVTTNNDMILIDSSALAGQPTDYDAATHTIRVPVNLPAAAGAAAGAVGLARPLAEVRSDILWEMHNASIRGALGRSVTKFNVAAPPAGASTEEKKKYPYMKAAFALNFEWEEWINVVEHDLKTQRMNAVAAMAATQVTRSFGASYAVPGAGWFLFTNYLADQIAAGHTTGYDPAANTATWKGKTIIQTVGKTAASLKITQKQVDDYVSHKTSKVKNVSGNPFKSRSIVTSAMRGS